MADEVEITNVGGENGVASEATLASLTRAIEKLAASTGKDPKKEAGKVQQQHTRTLLEDIKAIEKAIDAEKAKTKAVKKATEAVNRMSKAALGAAGGLLGSLTDSVLNLSSALVAGGDELSDFAQHIPLIGGLITPFTRMLDNSISTFRDLSSVGAGFNNSITEMRMTAAGLELNLDEMAGMVRSNSENLRLLGGTVTEGVSRFAAINKAVKATGNFAFLKNLGFTIEEVNEGIADYAALQSRMGRLQNMSVSQLAQGSTNYLVQLDRLAKVTGKSRKELEASMAAQAQDAGFRALANQFAEGSIELENFRSSMAIIDTLPADVAAGLKDLADGLPQTEEGIMVLTAAGPEIMEAMRQVADGADPQVILDALQAAGHDIERFGGLEGEQRAIYIAALRQSNPVLASILDSATRLMEVGTAEYDAAIAEQARREEITETLTTFDDAIKEMRATIASAILDSGLFEDLAGAVASVAETIKSEGFKNALKDFIGTIKSFIDNFRNFGLGTALFGGTEQVEGEDRSVEIKGLFENLFGEGGVISDAFASVTPQLTTMFTNILGSAFSAIGDGIISWFSDNWGKILIGALAAIGILIAAPFIGLGAVIVAPVLAVFAGIAAYFGAAEIKEWIIDAWNSITGVFSGIGEWWSNLSFTDMISNAYETVTGVFSGIGEWWSNLSFTDMISNAYETVTGVFSGIGEWWSNLSFTDMISNAWETVTGFFSFGDTTFSISGLISNAFESITGFFSLDNFEIPSISSLFQGIIDGVKDFFSFDFKLPNFREFLPTWLGGSGKSLSDTESTSENTIDPAAIENASSAGDALNQTQTALSTFAALPDLQNNLDILNRGLDIDGVRQYNRAMEQLVETLEDLNEVLAEDNRNMFGGGTGVAAADVLGQINTASTGSSEGINQLNRLMSQVLTVLQDMAEDSDNIERNTRSMGGNIANGRISAIRG